MSLTPKSARKSTTTVPPWRLFRRVPVAAQDDSETHSGKESTPPPRGTIPISDLFQRLSVTSECSQTCLKPLSVCSPPSSHSSSESSSSRASSLEPRDAIVCSNRSCTAIEKQVSLSLDFYLFIQSFVDGFVWDWVNFIAYSREYLTLIGILLHWRSIKWRIYDFSISKLFGCSEIECQVCHWLT